MREDYRYDEVDEIEEERRRHPKPATIIAIGTAAVVAVGIGGYIFVNGLNNEVNKAIGPGNPTSCASGYAGGNCLPTSSSPLETTSSPATTSAPDTTTTSTTPSTSSSPTATAEPSTATASSAPVPTPTAPPPPPIVTAGNTVVTPDFSQLGGDHEGLTNGYALNLRNTPETDGAILNNPNSDPSQQPHISYSSYGASALTAYCYVDGGSYQLLGGQDNRWVTIDTSSFIQSGGVASSQGDVAYAPARLVDNADTLNKCSPSDYSHNPAGM